METEKLGQEPAFPSEFEGTEKDFTGMPCYVHRKYYGMSRRFYAACAAMQGLLSNSMGMECGVEPPYRMGSEKLIQYSYELADELLNQENI